MAVWHEDPRLAGRFSLPEFPDDLQVLIHDGGPRLSQTQPELIWARVVEKGDGFYVGRCLNAPRGVKSVAQEGTFKFRATPRAKHPFQVGEKLLQEIDSWDITACNKCGFESLWDAPSELTQAIFKNLPDGAAPQAFTTFCVFCGGILLVKAKDFGDGEDDGAPAKPWWKFWA